MEWDQVVGHTPVKKITNIKESTKNKQNIWLCDALQYNEYLIIENGKFSPKKYKAFWIYLLYINIKNNYNMKGTYLGLLVGFILMYLTIIPSLILFIFSNICKIIYIIGNKTENFLFWYLSKIENYLI